MFTKCVLIALFAAVALAAPSNEGAPRSSESASGLYFGDFKFMYKVYQECAATDLTSCLKLKLISALDRAARSYNQVSLFEGVTFVKESNEILDDKVKSEAEIEAELPRALEERDSALNNMIFDKIGSFLETHTLKVKLPSVNDMQRSMEEGRGKKKKMMGGLMMIPLLLGGALAPLALGALALLAGKALIVSKLALVLAGIVGLKKLLGGGGGSHDSGHEVVVSSGHGSGWGRAYNAEEAKKLAYSAYTPNQTR